MAKIMSQMEEKSTPSPPKSHSVSSPNQSDLDNVDLPAPVADKK